jgi:hypothetical protein
VTAAHSIGVRSGDSAAHKAIDAIGDGFRASVRTNIWYRVSASGFCESCQADTRGVGLFAGPESYVARRYEGSEAGDWWQLSKFALIRSANGLDRRMADFIEKSSSRFLRAAHGVLKHHCEHCDAVVPDEVFDLALMERFSSQVSEDDLHEVGSFLMIEDAVLVSLLDDTTAPRRKRTRDGYFALARLRASDELGKVFTVDLHHNIIADDYAILIKGDDGKEIMALGFSDGTYATIDDAVSCLGVMGYAVSDVEISSSSIVSRVAVLLVIRALKAAGYGIDDDGAVCAEIKREVADLCSGN